MNEHEDVKNKKKRYIIPFSFSGFGDVRFSAMNKEEAVKLARGLFDWFADEFDEDADGNEIFRRAGVSELHFEDAEEDAD